MSEGPASQLEQEDIPVPEATSFEKQFERKKRYKSLGGEIEACFLKPENAKTAIPVVLAPGWSEGQTVLKQVAQELYVTGRPVIVLDHPRKGGEVTSQENYSTEELRKALTMQYIVEEESIPRVDIIAHSEGAINGAIFASLNPGKVRNMVLVDPAGLVGKDTFPGLVGRFAIKNLQNVLEALKDKKTMRPVAKSFAEGSKYITKNPLRAIQEAREISQAEIDKMLGELHKQGVGIVIIHGADDSAFPMERMQKVAKTETNPGGFVDGFLSVKGGHDELTLHPEQYTKAAEEMLSALEVKRPKNN